jgi:hypothetical protein
VGVIAVGERNKMLDAWTGRTTYTLSAAVWVKIHLGDPGAAGTSNPAANTTRQQATFGSAAASGTISNTVAVEWTNVSNTETYSWVSLWTASSGGTFLGSDQLSTNASVTAGDDFRIPIGDLDVSLT